MRHAFTLLHRWAGLLIAGFLFVAGFTGAIISWDHELDEWLNPRLHESKTQGKRLPVLDLVREVERRDPRARVTYIILDPPAGEALPFYVTGRVDPATGKQYDLDYSQIVLDPVTGAELGRRNQGAVWPINKENVISFLYRLHYTLHIPEMFGIDRWGTWLMGGIAMVWLIDSFVGFYLTLPVRKLRHAGRSSAVDRELGKGFRARWKPAWKIKTSGSAYRINFDIHRAFSLWTWAILFMLAFTSFSLNLYREIFFPMMSLVSTVTPSPYDRRTPNDRNNPIQPKVTFDEVIARARAEGRSRGWTTPAGSMFYSTNYGIYRVSFFASGEDHGAAGVGPAEVYYDGLDGRYLGDKLPWTGTAADIFVQAQFPLHSGRIIGLPGRILISFMGLVVATLSVTGVVIWWRKRRARLRVRATRAEEARGHPMPAE